MSAGLFALMSKKGREEKRLKELRDAFDAADKDKVSTETYIHDTWSKKLERFISNSIFFLIHKMIKLFGLVVIKSWYWLKDGQLTPAEWLNVLKATGVEASK